MTSGPQPATQPTADEVRSAAAAVLADQHPEAAAIAEKQARGETLTPRENGIVGWIRKKMSRKSDAPGQSNPARPGNAPDLEPGAPAEAPANGLPVPPADPGIVRRTTSAIVGRLESRDKRKVAGLCDSARQIPGVEVKTLARIERAAGLPPDDKALLLELAPDVFRELGIDPKKYATVVFFGVFALWRLDMLEAIDELRTIVKPMERPKADPQRVQTVQVVDTKAPPLNAHPLPHGMPRPGEPTCE